MTTEILRAIPDASLQLYIQHACHNGLLPAGCEVNPKRRPECADSIALVEYHIPELERWCKQHLRELAKAETERERDKHEYALYLYERNRRENVAILDAFYS